MWPILSMNLHQWSSSLPDGFALETNGKVRQTVAWKFFRRIQIGRNGELKPDVHIPKYSFVWTMRCASRFRADSPRIPRSARPLPTLPARRPHADSNFPPPWETRRNSSNKSLFKSDPISAGPYPWSIWKRLVMMVLLEVNPSSFWPNSSTGCPAWPSLCFLPCRGRLTPCSLMALKDALWSTWPNAFFTFAFSRCLDTACSALHSRSSNRSAHLRRKSIQLEPSCTQLPTRLHSDHWSQKKREQIQQMQDFDFCSSPSYRPFIFSVPSLNQLCSFLDHFTRDEDICTVHQLKHFPSWWTVHSIGSGIVMKSEKWPNAQYLGSYSR